MTAATAGAGLGVAFLQRRAARAAIATAAANDGQAIVESAGIAGVDGQRLAGLTGGASGEWRGRVGAMLAGVTGANYVGRVCIGDCQRQQQRRQSDCQSLL